MNPNQIVEHLQAQPFVPLRLHMSDGSHYDVPHPEFAAVSVREVAVAIGEIDESVPEKLAYLDPLHVTRIEPLISKRGKKNGKPKRRKKD